MSRYGDKHPHRPTCAIIGCEAPSTTLKNQRGTLGWWCDEHSDLAPIIKEPRPQRR